MADPSDLLKAPAFIEHFSNRNVGAGALRELHRWLLTLKEEAPGIDEALATLSQGGHWLLKGWQEKAPASASERATLLLDALDAVPAFRAALEKLLERVLQTADGESLFEAGLPNERGLWEETKERLAWRFLPEFRDYRDLSAVLGRVLPGLKGALWLEHLPTSLALRFAALLGEQAQNALLHTVFEAAALLSTRTSALGLSREMRSRATDTSLAGSPFFLLPKIVTGLEQGASTIEEARATIERCRTTLQAVLLHLEQYGVSVDVVYRIDVIDQNLSRIVRLTNVAEREGAARASEATSLLGHIMRQRLADRSLKDLLSTNSYLLARKIIERAGHTGEHYITATRAEYTKMLASAAGGGFLTAGTAALKFVVGWGRFPLFVDGLLASANYAASFLLIQLLGFTLATKQPSMTAAALAGALQGSGSKAGLEELVTLIARICRSQLAAVIGNVGVVVPAAILLDLAFQRTTGDHFLDRDTALYAIASLHPLKTGTAYYAALTGVILWSSSLFAGWLENWAIYHRLPEAIAQRRPRWLMRRLGDWFAHQVAGFGGNVSLGFMLGMTPVLGKFIGVPLEVRHVTLATGALTLAVCAVGADAPSVGLVGAIAGVAVTLMFNFLVSFTLALSIALRARKVTHAGRRLLVAIFRRFVGSPREFFLPPRSGEVS